MSDSILSLSVEDILNKKFTPDVKGYDPDEVDEFLDRINEDYVNFKKFEEDSKRYIVSLETKMRKLTEKIKELEVENAKFHSKYDGIKDSDSVNDSNIQYLNRIGKLEKALYELGGDPTEIK